MSYKCKCLSSPGQPSPWTQIRVLTQNISNALPKSWLYFYLKMREDFLCPLPVLILVWRWSQWQPFRIWLVQFQIQTWTVQPDWGWRSQWAKRKGSTVRPPLRPFSHKIWKPDVDWNYSYWALDSHEKKRCPMSFVIKVTTSDCLSHFCGVYATIELTRSHQVV